MAVRISIHEVKDMLGEEAAQKLMDAYPGREIYIPKKSSEFPNLEARDDFIYNMCTSSGRTYREVAELVDLSEDRVRRIVKDLMKIRIK